MSDFNPLLDDFEIGRVDLTSDGGLYAIVYSEPDFTPFFDDFDLTPLIGILDNAENAIPIDDDFDFQDEHVRGPYTLNQLNVFYRDSGLEDVVTTYYDDEDGSYYVYINTD